MESLAIRQIKAECLALDHSQMPKITKECLALDHSQMPKITKFKIGLCQFSVSSDKNINLDRAQSSIQAATNRGATVVVLPEMWNCPYLSNYFEFFPEDFKNKDCSPSFSMLSEVALDHEITIIGGTIPEKRNGRLYNTSCIFEPDGNLKAMLSKMHMFDVDIPGDIVFNESETFTAGDNPTIVDTSIYGCIGIGICHDICFSELATLYRAQGEHLICYPGAFNMSTGEALWELEQRARAADNQLYVATCSPSRDSVCDYMIWGHSTVVGPSGGVIASSSHEETVVIAEIDYSTIPLERHGLPLQKQKAQRRLPAC